MKRFAILVIMLCSFSQVHSTALAKEFYDYNRIHTQSIQKLIETEDSFDVARMHYQALIRLAEAKGDERTQAECLFQVACIHYWQSQYSMSLAGTKKVLVIAHRLNDKEMLAAGYDLLARLHYLFSPEQAQYYYRKCWQYCEQSDSVELTVSNLNSFNMIRKDREVDLDELLLIDTKPLSPLAKAWLGFNIARGMLAVGRTSEAAHYLDYTREYLQQHSEASPLNAMYEHRLGQLDLLEGDTKQAWEHVGKSMAIVRKNKILMGIVQNFDLSSQIAQAENKEGLALEFYKKSVALRDSIFKCPSNLYFPDALVYTMMDNIAADQMKNSKKNRLLITILSGLILIAGVSLFYHFKSTRYHKKSKATLADIKELATNGLHSRMKNHLMRIMYGYKAGVSYCLQHSFEGESTEHLTIFEENIQDADDMIDTLIDWVESNPDMIPENVEFDVSRVVKQLVAFYKIGFVPKSITYQQPAGQSIMVSGDKYMFTIALEHLFFRMVKVAAKHAAVHVSISGNDSSYAVISIADHENKERVLEKEIFAQRIAEIETTGKATHTADWDFNIFAECTVRNRAKVQIECTPEKGTVYYYYMPFR